MSFSFQIQNFKSILDLELDLTYSKVAPKNNHLLESYAFLSPDSARENRSVPVFGIYGANASGKTCIIEAIRVFQALLKHGIETAYAPNKLNPHYQATTFMLDVLIDSTRYIYAITFNDNRILSESLKTQQGELLFLINDTEKSFSKIKTEIYDDDRLKEIWRVECTDGNNRFVRPFVYRLANSFAGLNLCVTKLVKEMLENLFVTPINKFYLSQGIDWLAGEDTDEARARALEKISTLLKKFDVGISSVALRRQQLEEESADSDDSEMNLIPGTEVKRKNGTLIADTVITKHKDINGNEVNFNFMAEESTGTQITAGLIGIFLWALETGKTIFLDEIDISLHPFILVSLIKLFKSKHYNKTNARLIFTLHDTTPLDDGVLRTTEVGILSKTLKSGTRLTRLCDYKGVRDTHNFQKHYLEGLYGGIPFPYV